MGMETVKRMACDILGVGISKIRIPPESAKKVAEALTRDDVKGLIEQGAIGYIVPRGVSRAKARKKQAQKRSGRRSGKGSRKGTKYSKVSKKESWVAQVRAQRGLLRRLSEKGEVAQEAYRKVYLMIKGNAFKSKGNLLNYLKENGMLKKQV